MKKLLALLLTLCLVIGMVPLAAGAEETNVAKIGDTEYETLQAAIDAAGSNDVGTSIVLIADAKENVTVGEGKTVSIDLAGFTLNGGTESGKAALTNNGTVTITDSSEGKTGKICREDTAEKQAEGTTAYYVIHNKKGSLTIQGGTIFNDSGYAGSGSSLICNGARPYTDKPELTISGGKLQQDNFIVIKNDENGILNVTGGEVVSGNEQSVQNWSKATISGDADIQGDVVTWTYTGIMSEDITTKIDGAKVTGEVQSALYGTLAESDELPEIEITNGAVITGNVGYYTGGGASSTAGGKITISNSTVTGTVSNKGNGETSVTGSTVGSIGGTVTTTEVTVTNPDSISSQASIGGKYYATLAEAIESAKSGDTIKLVRDIENAMDTEGAPNGTAAYTIPAGVTLDGGGHKITASSNWKATSHPIIGVTAGAGRVTTTIKNLTIDGSGKSGHGINVWSGSEPKANVKVENVTINNTATAGMVVNNSIVEASGLKTKGNAWGAVNVDKGASFTLTGTDNELKDRVQVYSEDAGKKNGSKITVKGTGLKEVKSYNKNEGSDLKGYTYYTDDVSKLGEAYNATTNTVYEDADDAINEAKANQKVQIVKNATLENDDATVADGVTLQVPAGVTLTGNLTNNGALDVDGTVKGNVTNKGTIDLDGTIDGNVTNEGTIDYDGKITGTLTNQNGGKVEYPYVPPVIPTYKTTVEECEGGSVVASPSSAREGQKVTLTVKPQAGQELKSLKVTDKDGDAVTLTKIEGGYTFNMPKGGVTVTAVFGCDGGSACPSKGFTDVDSEKWYHEYMDYAVEKGLLEGTSPTTMEPNATLTRAQLAQVLYNLEGKPAVTGDLPFEDVAEGKWYYAAILWANQEGVVDGMSPDTFAPNEDISRQDLALMLYRYAGEPTVTGDLDGFKDAGQVGDWAEEAITWAVEEGIIDGMTPTTLEPTGTATRAQAAAMLQRFLEG